MTREFTSSFYESQREDQKKGKAGLPLMTARHTYIHTHVHREMQTNGHNKKTRVYIHLGTGYTAHDCEDKADGG